MRKFNYEPTVLEVDEEVCKILQEGGLWDFLEKYKVYDRALEREFMHS